MTFINTRLPQRLLAGFVIGPRWQTELVEMDNGRERPDAKWLYPRYEASGSLGALNAEDRQALRTLFMACRGRKNAFRVRDPLDWTATAQPLVTVGGVTYLAKAYTYGSETAYRLIQAPVTATLSGAGSVDLETGIVTGADPETDTWTGTFDIWMRFESDWNAVNAITPDVVTADIELVERRR
jgi:uncharacterized protein (TIGR02217 family)